MPHTTLRKILSKHKDAIPIMMMSGMVYHIPCQEYDATYIGQTGRKSLQCIKEHRRAVKKLDTLYNAKSEHVCQLGTHLIRRIQPS